MDQFRNVMEFIGTAVDAGGVLIVVAGALFATGRFLFPGRAEPTDPYRRYRQDLGRAILLGLEFLVAGDIIRTVVVAPTLENVIVLGLIVLIRTFLSMSLELELEGRWPWQRVEAGPSAAPPPRAGDGGEPSQPPQPTGPA
jgi:uncharacterized membrane protein